LKRIKGEGNLSFPFLRDLKGLTEEFMAVKKSRKFPSFEISSYFEDSAFTAFKRNATFLTRYVNEAPLILSRGEPFLSISTGKV